MEKQKITNIQYLILAIVLITGAIVVWNMRSTIDSDLEKAENAKLPADIELVFIVPNDCEKCQTVSNIETYTAEQDLRITSSETLQIDSNEATDLINKYGISKLPAFIVSGEYEKENVKDVFDQMKGKQENEKLIVEPTFPVYFDLETNTAVGVIDITYLIDNSCVDCYDPKGHDNILIGTFGISIGIQTMIDI